MLYLHEMQEGEVDGLAMTEEARFREVNELFQLVIPRFDSFIERTDDCDCCPFFEEECSGDGAERCLAEDVLMLLNMGAEYQKQLDQVTRERDAAVEVEG